MNYFKSTIKPLFIFVLLMNGLLAAVAQNKNVKDYTPLKYSTSASRSTFAAYIKKLDPPYLTKNKDEIKDINKFLYTVHLTHVLTAKSKFYIQEPFMVKYLQTILDTITKKNNLKGPYEIHITRDVAVNAYNMGNNRIYVNIGLLKLMTNEAQIAFLLAHELSHYLLLHVQEKFLKSRALSKSKEVKREIKDIKKAKYNKSDRSAEFVKTYGYDFAKNDRRTERAADSMAIVLIGNTDYELGQGVALMQILEKSDKDSTEVDYAKYFDSKTYQVNKNWLTEKEKHLSFGEKEVYELDKDSISTHPAIPFRIEMIQKQMKNMNYNSKNKLLYMQPKSLLDSIVYCSEMEEIEVYKKNKRYSAIVFTSLALLEKFPTEMYLHRNAVVALDAIVKSMEEHKIQDHVPVEAKELSIGYIHLLRIIDHSKPRDMKEALKSYLNNYYGKIGQYEEVKTIYEKITKQ